MNYIKDIIFILLLIIVMVGAFYLLKFLLKIPGTKKITNKFKEKEKSNTGKIDKVILILIIIIILFYYIGTRFLLVSF
jgi:hypothetical protein